MWPGSKTVNVRQALQEDSRQLFELARRWPPGSWLVRQDEDGSYVLDHTRIANPSWCVLTAHDENSSQVVGYLVGYNTDFFRPPNTPTADRQVAKLEEIAVLPDWQRNGIGRLLVAAFENWARRESIEILTLGGGAAPDFYEKLGYKRVGYCIFTKVL
jgi:GNAT superfamily N-acetyltransferase